MSAGDRGPVAGVGGRVGKSGKPGVSHGKGEGACWCKLYLQCLWLCPLMWVRGQWHFC